MNLYVIRNICCIEMFVVCVANYMICALQIYHGLNIFVVVFNSTKRYSVLKSCNIARPATKLIHMYHIHCILFGHTLLKISDAV